ncbi:MAG: MarR family winged helix-turn-helix transcriptional regulator [Vicinamibacteria bacterium]
MVNHLRHLFKAIREYSKAMQRKAGLSSPQAWALRILDDEPGLALGALARRMYSHPSTVCGVVDRMVERGVVAREVNRSDRRGVVLSLTPAGRRLLKASPPPVQVGLARALEAMPSPRLRQLSQTLAEIVRRTEADRLEAPFFDVAD